MADARLKLTVWVKPSGRCDEVHGWAADEMGRPILKLQVAAAAADGAANAAVIALVAKALRLPKSAIRIAAGQTARVKRLEIAGGGTDDIADAFGQA